jgi:Transglutaminase-like superfamily
MDNQAVGSSRLPQNKHRLFRFIWRGNNLLLVLCALLTIYAAGWEFSVRHYLDGFSDAIVPSNATPEEKVDAILDWMREGPQRALVLDPRQLSARDPETTLNYQQLLSVCGTATNAFLNLARSSDLQVRRLLLLTPERVTKHVVAEVLLDGRWAIVDPTYRVIMRDAQGRPLTRTDLKNPELFAQAIARVPGYPADYNYQTFAHVRMARIPLEGFRLRKMLNFIYPGWEEAFDWSLLLERESFFVFFVSALATLFLVFGRFALGWYADRRLKIPRFHLRQNLLRAGSAFITTPEIK